MIIETNTKYSINKADIVRIERVESRIEWPEYAKKRQEVLDDLWLKHSDINGLWYSIEKPINYDKYRDIMKPIYDALPIDIELNVHLRNWETIYWNEKDFSFFE